MSGYREQDFDPNAYQRLGPPLRPFSRAQWAGVGAIAAGLGLYLVVIAGRIGWMPRVLDSTLPGLVLTMIGIPLINSRRAILSDPAPELAEARKRWMIITVTLCSAVLGAALIIDFAKGA